MKTLTIEKKRLPCVVPKNLKVFVFAKKRRNYDKIENLGRVRITWQPTGVAVLSVGLGGPVANTLVLVEPEAGGADVLLSLAVDTGVEDVAGAGVGVSVEAVQTWALVVGSSGSLCGQKRNKIPDILFFKQEMGKQVWLDFVLLVESRCPCW